MRAMQHEDRILTRKVEATLIPHGDLHSLEEGDKVTITHRLGGNYTVMTLTECIESQPKMPMPWERRPTAILPKRKINRANLQTKTGFVTLFELFSLLKFP